MGNGGREEGQAYPSSPTPLKEQRIKKEITVIEAFQISQSH